MRIKQLITTEKRMIPSEQHRMRLLILRPAAQPDRSVPGVLWIHGGGYQSGSARSVYVTRALPLAAKYGAVIVAPDYRLSKRYPYPAALQDCYAALLYLKEHAEELGVRPDQIMVGGESAGGGMTTALCMLAHDRGEVNIAYQMPLYPMLDDRDTASSADNHAPNWNTRRNHIGWRLYLRGKAKERVSSYAAPANQTDYADLPPCYTFVGDGEPFYDETLAYVENLKKAGVKAEVDVYPTNMHAFDALSDDALSREAIRNFEAHFEEALKLI